jgi:response regulator RpfG family c-di-GMP phosphodiesterase
MTNNHYPPPDDITTAPGLSPDNTDWDDCMPKPWKIIIADDEAEVHKITEMVLSDYVFDNRPLAFYRAYTGEETKRLIEQHPDTAIILLDVVMEFETAGLEVTEYIRKILKNHFVRIMLRTGQPGSAPEKQVIMEYDINEYKEKTELTTDKLYTTVTALLRSYKDLTTIDKTRRVLELVIQSSENIFGSKPLTGITTDVLKNILEILDLDKTSLYIQAKGSSEDDLTERLKIVVGTGRFARHIDADARKVLPKDVLKYIETALRLKEGVFVDNTYVGYFDSESGTANLLFLKGCVNLNELEKDLIRMFASNLAIVIDNLYLSREIVDTQKEVIFTLGELVEARAEGMANHIRRVADFSALLALKAGLSNEKAQLLKLASPMHDVGKIGISDTILNKNGRLSVEEFETIKKHSWIGHNLLKKSKQDILKAATIVALQHHERWDGNGYPQGLAGKEIHTFGRITCLADVFDALTHHRIYKKAWERESVVDYIRSQRGKRFDPELVDLFVENIDEFFAVNGKYPESG